jgi:gliding-associated putative ABC transporter substrate-binding component GldG
MKRKKSIVYQILLILGVLILINILSDKFFHRFDLTADKRYTLSKATKDILRNLDEPVTVTAYFTENLPPQFSKTRSDFKDLLVEYGNVSKGKIQYDFIDPNIDQQSETKAMKQGIQPVLINVREKDQMKQQKAYLGAVIQKGEQTDVIPFMQQGASMEYALSSSIKKLTVRDKPVIGFLQGHGEPPINNLQQAYNALAILYDVEPIMLTDTTYLRRFKTIAIVAPVDSFPNSHLKKLDEYLASGGNIFIAMKRVDGNLSQSRGTTINTGLEKWLAGKGLTVNDNFIIDASCGSVGVRQSQGLFNFTSNVRFPYLPLITTFAKHPVTSGLESVMLPFASSISFTRSDSSITFTPIAFTSQKTGTQQSPVYFDIQKRWSDQDFPLSTLPVAGVLSGRLAGNANSRIVLVSNGDFAVNGSGQQAQQLQADNVNLLVNSIDWLSDDTGLIELRTKDITARPLDQIAEGKKVLLKYMNFLLPILIIVLYGVIRAQRNRNRRIKRMEEGYV